jgi:hypothetical protein
MDTFKFKITLDRHNGIQNLNYYDLPDPSRFSLPSTFKIVLKSSLYVFFYFVQKSIYLLTCGSFKPTKELGSANGKPTNPQITNPQITIRINSQISNPRRATFSEGPQI